jgi:hypothetical protein
MNFSFIIVDNTNSFCHNDFGRCECAPEKTRANDGWALGFVRCSLRPEPIRGNNWLAPPEREFLAAGQYCWYSTQKGKRSDSGNVIAATIFFLIHGSERRRGVSLRALAGLRVCSLCIVNKASYLWQTIVAMPYWFDGNNLIGRSAAAAKEQPQIRRAFLSTLGSYHASHGGKYLVYFDGDDPGNSPAPPGIATRYSAPLSADQTILRRLCEIRNPSEIIVVTNDRALGSSCRNAGASTLNWREFDSRMNRGRIRSGEAGESKDPVNVEEWMRYFGLDKQDT